MDHIETIPWSCPVYLTQFETEPETQNPIAEDQRDQSKNYRPRKYQVFLLNDDYTPMDFVVIILQQVFSKTLEEAQVIMLSVHHRKKGLAGIYSREVAETKINKVHQAARENLFPLTCSMEVNDDTGGTQ